MDSPRPADEQHIQEMQEKLGHRIRRLREAKGWSQDTFAHLAGLNRAYPHKIERAKVDLRFSTLVRIAHVFDITVEGLLKLD